MRAKHIVGEVSVGWPQPGIRIKQAKDSMTGVIANRFENLIAYHEQRGYALESWKFSQVCPEPCHIIETIVAVFVATSQEAREKFD